jgi:formylglycine-generating enzyme required for sulfatase activity/serine/threonine protein kinase
MLAEHIQLPEEGQRIGGYVLEQRLSISILGAFYRATRDGNGCLVHVLSKALPRADSRFESRYREVVARQSALDKSVLLPVAEIVREDDYLLVVYPDGDYIGVEQEILSTETPVPEKLVGRWLMAIARGLREAAEIGIGHYFLTPGFLFFDGRGGIRIAGLGLFQSIQYNQFESFVSGSILPIRDKDQDTLSAIEILSPEIRNYKARDRRSDFYCIGMCAYFFITKRKPAQKWILPVDSRPGIDPEWNLLISRCLEPRPSDRYTGFAEFEEAVLAVTGEAVSEKQPSRRRRILSKLPTPGWLWGRRLRLTRLILLGIAGLLIIATASMLIEILLTDFEEPQAEKQLLQVGPDTANLVLRLESGDAQVRVRGPANGVFSIDAGTPLHLKSPPGHYRLRVQGPGALSELLDFTVEPSTVREILLRPDLDLYGVTFEGVAGSQVEVVSEGLPQLYVGELKTDGAFTTDPRFQAGSYSFILRHPQYATTSPVTVSVPTGKPIQFEQAALPALLTVLSDPPGASVLIDGEMIGKTPLSSFSVPAERALRMRIESAGYLPYEETFRGLPGKAVIVDGGELARRTAQVQVTLSTLEGLSVPLLAQIRFFLNGETIAVSEAGNFIVPYGAHKLMVEAPGFVPRELQIVVGDAGPESVEVFLDPLPAGIVPQLPESVTARFRMDGAPVELDEDGAISIPAGEPVVLEVIMENYYSVTQRFQESERARIDWEVPLKRLPGPEFGKEFKPPYFDLPLLWMEAGRFTMGSPVTEYRRLPNEDNRTVVRFSAGYWIGRFEVKQALWTRIMGSNSSEFVGDDHPVESISWEEATAFCQRLTEFERSAGRLPDGYVYRLPTEAEWEYAARAGSLTPFSFGAEGTPEMANFAGLYSPDEKAQRSYEDHYGTLPTGSFEPNAWGLFDVHGNVAEWTCERYWDRLPGGAVVDPVNLDKGRGYSIRGGGWTQGAHLCRSSARDSLSKGSKRNWVGFRVALAKELP